jgi:ribosomal protein S27AE
MVAISSNQLHVEGVSGHRRLCPHCGVAFLERVSGRAHAACVELTCPHCGTSVWAFSAPVAQAAAPADWAGAGRGDGA